MRTVRTTAILALAAGAFLASSPTLAAGAPLVSSPALGWKCTAQNADGASYTAAGVLKVNARTRALLRCRIKGPKPLTCRIDSCTPS